MGKIDKKISELSEQGVGYGDILAAAADMFPTRLLGDTCFIFDPDSDVMVGGMGKIGESDVPTVYMGTKGGIPERRRKLTCLRLDIPPEYDDSKYDEMFLRIAFAHELGHVIQSAPEAFPGDGFDETSYDPKEDYLAYVQSDKELHADYMAAMLVGSTFGPELGIEKPIESPAEWRESADRLQAPNVR